VIHEPPIADIFMVEIVRGVVACALQPGLGASRDFLEGLPFGTIDIGDRLSSFSVDTTEHVITHEIARDDHPPHSERDRRGDRAVDHRRPRVREVEIAMRTSRPR